MRALLLLAALAFSGCAALQSVPPQTVVLNEPAPAPLKPAMINECRAHLWPAVQVKKAPNDQTTPEAEEQALVANVRRLKGMTQDNLRCYCFLIGEDLLRVDEAEKKRFDKLCAAKTNKGKKKT